MAAPTTTPTRRDAPPTPPASSPAPPAPGTSGFHSLTRPQLFATIGGVMLGLLLSSLDQTIVGTALPKVIADLQGFNHYSWVVTAYLLTSTTSVPIFGKLSDIFGRKWLYIGGISLFLVGSALCGASQTMTQLIVFRGLQGIGAGMMSANAFTIIGDIFPPAERGKWQGIFSSVFGLSSVVGPALGGWITDTTSWRWVFYVNIPIGIVALAVLVIGFPFFRPAAGVKRVIDWGGVATLILAVVPLLLALSWAGTEYAWGSVQVLGLLAFAVVMTGVFLAVEARAEEPVLPLDLFRNKLFATSAVAVFVSGLALFSVIIYIPLFVQGVIGSSASGSGAILTPFMLSLITGSTLSGQIISRTGRYKVLAVGGFVVSAIGVALLTTLGVGSGNGAVIAYMIVTGVGTGLTFPVFTIAVQSAFPRTQLGVVTSATQFFRQIGGTLGSAIMGAVLTNRFGAELAATLPEGVRAALPTGQLAAFNNPQVLVSPQTQAQLRAVFGRAGAGADALYNGFFAAVRDALASGIHVVFVISFAFALVALAATALLPEIPLRGRDGTPAPAAPPQSEADTPPLVVH